MDVVGVVVLVLFYLAVLAVGIGAARWFSHKHHVSTDREVALVAGRKLGGVVGVFTMIATTVGGGYINGTAESVARDGLVWTLAPFGIFLGLIIGGVVYAGRMRKAEYVTMFDPFQKRYGHVMVVLLYLAAMAADIFWSASILVALGTSLGVILDLQQTLSIIVSAAVAVLYTVFGHMVAVAYTDIIQLVFITLGLVSCVPFAMTHSAVASITTTRAQWVGSLPQPLTGLWSDLMVAMTFGTIPWQTYFQRVLSVKTTRQAQLLSVVGAFGALVLAVPSVLIGTVAVSTNWTATESNINPLSPENASLVLPIVIYYLTPRVVGILGLGAIAAAVMSSLDSAILASASVFSHNIWGAILRRSAGDTELIWVHRIAVIIIAAIATVIAIFVSSIYGLFILAADLVFCLMLPQLTAVLFLPWTNTYGALSGYILALILRIGAGETYIDLKPFIFYPFYSNRYGQLFPFRTFTMIWSFAIILIVSRFTRFLFKHNVLPPSLDVFRCFAESQVVLMQPPHIPHGDIVRHNGRLLSDYQTEDTGDVTRTDHSDTWHEMQALNGSIQNGGVPQGASSSNVL